MKSDCLCVFVSEIVVELNIVLRDCWEWFVQFLVACYATLHPALSVSRLVGRSSFWQRPRRGRWPMHSQVWGIFSSFFYVPPSPQPPGPYLSFEAHIPASRPKSQSWGPNPSLKAQILAKMPKSKPGGPDPSLEAQISAWRLKSQPWGLNPIFEAQRLGFRPQGRDLVFRVRILASRLRFGPWG